MTTEDRLAELEEEVQILKRKLKSLETDQETTRKSTEDAANALQNSIIVICKHAEFRGRPVNPPGLKIRIR